MKSIYICAKTFKLLLGRLFAYLTCDIDLGLGVNTYPLIRVASGANQPRFVIEAATMLVSFSETDMRTGRVMRTSTFDELINVSSSLQHLNKFREIVHDAKNKNTVSRIMRNVQNKVHG